MVRVDIIGRLGDSPQEKTDKNGETYITFSIATDDFVNGKQETVWFNVIYFGKITKKALEFFGKGSLINVCGYLSTNTWVDKNGTTRISQSVRAIAVDRIKVGKSQQPIPTTDEFKKPSDKESENEQQVASVTATQASMVAATAIPTSVDDIEDDLPF